MTPLPDVKHELNPKVVTTILITNADNAAYIIKDRHWVYKLSLAMNTVTIKN